MRRTLAGLLALLVLAGCGGTGAGERAPLTERERDSVLAEQPLPGAGAVGGALDAADRAAADAARTDAAIDSLPR
jgi:hypothetical protein